MKNDNSNLAKSIKALLAQLQGSNEPLSSKDILTAIKEDLVEDILFMIDTSGSMSDEMIAHAFSEVKGAIEQFDGKLKGWLGFFGAAIIEPKPFSDIEEFKLIKAAGGGGTNFQIIFEYVAKYMEKLPASIIVLTDGYAPFPEEKETGGIPVLWLLNNEEVQPPWGKVARIKVYD